MKIIIYTNDDGWISTVAPCYPTGLSSSQQDEFLQFVKNKDVPPLSDGSTRQSYVKDNESDEIKQMGLFFESWRINSSGNVIWDKNAANELKKNQFRDLRKPLLEKLDVDFMRALEDGNTSLVSTIAAKKKELRDITDIDLSAYDTPQKLKDFMPEILK